MKTEAHCYNNLQVGDMDLMGNKFNGHNLHLLLEQCGVHSLHCVQHKYSSDAGTILANPAPGENYAQWLLRSSYFANSDLIHLHLIQNTDFDIQLLPLMSRLKPMVITLHDCYFLGGHCIHHGSCDKWKTQCYDCEHLDSPIAIAEDTSAIRFLQNKIAWQNSNISVIVSSKWMENKVAASPVFAGKTVYRVPFGVDQSVFCPADTALVRRELNIPEQNFVVMFRADKNPFKGLALIRDTLSRIRFPAPVTLLLVGQKGEMRDFKDRFDVRDYGWLTDDRQLARLYQACDLFLMPSKQESFGMMAIEAMSCGKTVLATAGTALDGVMNSPNAGIAVPEADFEAELQSLVDNPAKRAQHGEASLQFAREAYSSQRYVESMQQAYDDILRRFVPVEHADVVLANLAANADHSQRNKPKERPLYQSFSWRATKIFRAWGHFPNGNVFQRIKSAANYLFDQKIDQVDDISIRNSRSWEITEPIRRVVCFFIDIVRKR